MKFINKFWNSIKHWYRKGWMLIKNKFIQIHKNILDFLKSIRTWISLSILLKLIKEIYSKRFIIVSIVAALICLILLFIIFFENIATYFFPEKDSNGELFKVTLSLLGGVGIFYGLFINSRRIQEQTRQNNISEFSNSDKRFSEAIGYLGSDVTSIALGGIYALYQLAKEDSRYTSIVANLFTSYLQEKTTILYRNAELISENERVSKELNTENRTNNNNVPIIVKTIVELLFNEERIFRKEKLDLSNTLFKYFDFDAKISNCSFKNSVFISCRFYETILDCNFDYSTLESVKLGTSTTLIGCCSFWNTNFNNCTFGAKSICDSGFEHSIFSQTIIMPTEINTCNFSESNFVKGSEFYRVNGFYDVYFSLRQKGTIKFNECDNMYEIFYV